MRIELEKETTENIGIKKQREVMCPFLHHFPGIWGEEGPNPI
jgi:hypothetical protein